MSDTEVLQSDESRKRLLELDGDGAQDFKSKSAGEYHSNQEDYIGDENTDIVKTERKKVKLEKDEELNNTEEIVRGETKSSSKKNSNIIVVPNKPPRLFYTPLKTGLVYDVRMRYHAKIFTSYFEYIDPHPEDPRRIYRIYKQLAEAGLINDSSLSGVDDIGPLMLKIPIREATASEILEVHSESHFGFIQSTETMNRERLLEETEKGDSIYVNNDSFFSAKLSCGGTIEACRAVVEGRVKNSLAVVRPPGHHAEPDAPGGFCLFSNVAVATKNILKNYPESVRKIVIVDWDIHHGNGTQSSFLKDPRVLYISLHRYENGKFYPGTKYGNADIVGEGAGEGYNINIPWRSPGMHDADYMYAFNKIVMPVISEFDPDLVIVSSGFDAADGDTIGCCHVTPTGYGQMTHMLKSISRGKLAVVLEGGYNLDSIARSALGVAKVLVGEPPDNTVATLPLPETIEVVDEVIKIQSKYWKSLRVGVPESFFDNAFDLPNENKTFTMSSLADSLRAHQSNELFHRYGFVNLPLVGSKDNGAINGSANGIGGLIESSNSSTSHFTVDLPSHLEDLVLASPNVNESSTIIVYVHDSPEVWANVNPLNGTIEASSSVVLEHPLTQIIEKLRTELDSDVQNVEGNGSGSKDSTMGHIDIYIPPNEYPVSGGASASTSQASTSGYVSSIFGQELLLYLWDNYISYFSQAKKVVFVGFGDAYQAIVHLFAKRPSQTIKDIVKGTVIFLNRGNLKSLAPVMDESMIDWYYQNSVIFTSYLHSCWAGSGSSSRNGGNGVDSNGSDEISKRPRRKFGRVIKTSSDSLWDVIHERFDEGVDFILDSIEDYSTSEST